MSIPPLDSNTPPSSPIPSMKEVSDGVKEMDKAGIFRDAGRKATSIKGKVTTKEPVMGGDPKNIRASVLK